ncbi:MAG TPA: HAMP domain-containing sensor histidine kinase [Rhizomicrobium sp.]|nr:HAMP domain-containing sensor histidine kinase [Rhizomicrobium sp.]
MNRRSATTIVSGIRDALDALDGRISHFGRFGSTAILTAMTVCTAVSLHILVRALEGLSIQPLSTLNLCIEVAIVSGPIIFYARDVIAQLKHSRAKMNEMSRRLKISVEQAEQANRAKSDFLANMSHELRTPLNAIMGFSEVMKEQHLGPMNNQRYLSYAGDILASGSYLLGIINDILDLSKIEAGKMTVENAEEFPLCQALEGSLAICTSLGEKFGVRIESRLPPEDVRLFAVERMIRQIMINLVGNAIKFTPSGGHVQVTSGPKADGGYAVTILDSGIGMTDQEIVKALTPFGQIENKITATHNGTGLGLPLAKAMLELHDGHLEISSAPGCGTKIVMHFPASRLAVGRRVAAA